MRAVLRNKLGVAAVTVLALVVLVALLAPLVAPYDPSAQDLLVRLHPPAWTGRHPTCSAPTTSAATSSPGFVYGARISLLVGACAALLAGVIGAAIGLVAGFLGGWFDRILMRLADIQLAFPSILLALAMVGVPRLRPLVRRAGARLHRLGLLRPGHPLRGAFVARTRLRHGSTRHRRQPTSRSCAATCCPTCSRR